MSTSKKIKFSDAIGEALEEEMEKDEKVIIMGEDIRYGYMSSATKGLLDKFGEDRVLDTPLSENSFIGTGVGLAMMGHKTIVEIMFDDLLMLGSDQLANQAPKIRTILGGQLRVPLVVRAYTGHFPAPFGPHHSQSLASWFVNIPGLKVVEPTTPYEAKGLLKTAINHEDPVLFLESIRLHFYGEEQEIPDSEYYVSLEDSIDVTRKGEDVAIIASGWMVKQALEASEQLAQDGIDSKIINLRVLDPLDEEGLVDEIRDIGRVVVVDEGYKRCGVGAEISAILAEKGLYYLETPIKRVNALNTPIPANLVDQERVIPNKDNITEAVKEIM